LPIPKEYLTSIFHSSLPFLAAKGKEERKKAKRKEDRRFKGAGLPILDSEFVVSLNDRPPVCGLVLPPTETLSNRLVFCQNLRSPSPIIILLFPRSVVVRPACLKKRSIADRVHFHATTNFIPKSKRLSSITNYILIYYPLVTEYPN
jgi:hypothetical protein